MPPVDPGAIRCLGILAGSGALPRSVAEACAGRGVDVFVVDLGGAAGGWIAGFTHERVALGQVGRVMALLSREGCEAVTMAGGVVRPPLSSLRFDRQGLALLPRLARLFRQGDDGLLSGVADIFEEHGFPVIGPDAFLPRAIAPAGSIVGTVSDTNEIETARAILDALSAFDIGQAVVVAQGRCLAVEAAEGTGAMLDRVAALRAATGETGGVLVKMPKRGQDARIDRPAIGPDTVRAAAAAGLDGIAVEAGGVFMLDDARLRRLAVETGLFLHGFEP